MLVLLLFALEATAKSTDFFFPVKEKYKSAYSINLNNKVTAL